MSSLFAAVSVFLSMALAVLGLLGSAVVMVLGAGVTAAVARRLAGRRLLAVHKSPRRLRRERRQERRKTTWRQEGMDDVYNLRGVKLRLTPHELVVEGWLSDRRIPVHELLGAWRKRRTVMVIGLGGEEIALGRSRATLESLNASIQGLTEGIQKRRRGSLEDKTDMEQALDEAGLATR